MLVRPSDKISCQSLTLAKIIIFGIMSYHLSLGSNIVVQNAVLNNLVGKDRDAPKYRQTLEKLNAL